MKPYAGVGALAVMLALSACGAGVEGNEHADSSGNTHPAPIAEAAPAHDAGHAAGHADEKGEAHDDPHDEAHEDVRQTTIPAAIALASGIRVQAVGPGVIADEHEVRGLLTPMDGRVALVTARFPGPIRALHGDVGDRVRAGQVLATVESNLSLSTYTARAPISGVITARHASVGGMAAEGAPLFEIADLSQLWVDLHIFGADAGHIQPGVPVVVTRMSDGMTVQTRLERVLPGMVSASQSAVARSTLDNADGLWRPGAAVKARITVARQPVEWLVPLAALQTMDGAEVVFVREGDSYRAQPVQTGLRDAERVQVVAGLKQGDRVVVQESYLIKADIEKSGAAHDH